MDEIFGTSIVFSIVNGGIYIMKKKELLATVAIATTAIGLLGTVVCLVRKRKHQKRLEHISDAGYELAYDIHYPTKYKR